METVPALIILGSFIAIILWSLWTWEILPRRRRVEQDNAIAMANTVAAAQSRLADQIMPVPRNPADNDIVISHHCANCGRIFEERSNGAVWTASTHAPQRVWYCSTECAESMPFLPDHDALAYARSVRSAMEREFPGRAPSVYAEAIRLRRQHEAQIAANRRRVEFDMRAMRERYGINHPPPSRRSRRRPTHFTGQEPEDL